MYTNWRRFIMVDSPYRWITSGYGETKSRRVFLVCSDLIPRIMCARDYLGGDHTEDVPSRRGADRRDELAALHVWMAPAWQEIIWRAAQRSLAVMSPACWC